MTTIKLRLLLVPLLCLTVNTQKPCALSCVNDYEHTMDCLWRERNDKSLVTLRIYPNWTNKSSYKKHCTLTRSLVLPREEEGCVHSYTCTMNVLRFASYHKYRLVLEANSQANTSQTCIVENFKPSWNIQLKPPQRLSVTVNSTSRQVNITWQNIDAENYLTNCLEHELEYWSRNTREDAKVKSKTNDIRHLAIEETELDPDTKYTARVRSRPQESVNYRGSWSTWSSDVKWKTDPAVINPSKASRLFLVILAPLTVALIIFISLYFRIPSRVVGKVWIHIPNPASFFQPLYSEHNGNFKEWIRNEQGSVLHSPGGACVQELREVKRPLEGEAVVVLNPRVEAVSNISYLKPIPSGLDLGPHCTDHSADLGTMYVKSNRLSSSFYCPALREHCDSDCGLGGLLPVGQGPQGAVSWPLGEGPTNTALLAEPDGGYTYSDEYCTLSHSDTSHSLLHARIALRPKATHGGLAGKREVAEGPGGVGGEDLPSAWPAAEETPQLPH